MPSRRAAEASTKSSKKIQTWAPLPDRERSKQAGTPTWLHTSKKARLSNSQLPLSKSHARSRQRSPSISGYRPAVIRPDRCADTTESSIGRYRR